jgi:hypothetical protein
MPVKKSVENFWQRNTEECGAQPSAAATKGKLAHASVTPDRLKKTFLLKFESCYSASCLKLAQAVS